MKRYLAYAFLFSSFFIAILKLEPFLAAVSIVMIAYLMSEERNKNKEGNKVEFSDRQKKILRLIAQGYTAREVADLLGVTRQTIEREKKEIMRKISVLFSEL